MSNDIKYGFKTFNMPTGNIDIFLRFTKDKSSQEQNNNFIKNAMVTLDSSRITSYIKLFNFLQEHIEINKKEFLNLIDDKIFSKELSKIPFNEKEMNDVLNELADIQGPIYSIDEEDFINKLLKPEIVVGFDEKNEKCNG